MKKLILIPVMLAFLLALTMSQPANAQINVAVLDVSLVSQNPYPAEPGSNMNLEVKIENTGTSEAKNIVVEILQRAPFTLLSGETSKKTINQIGPDSSVQKTYDLFITTSAVSSTYDIDFKIYAASTPNTYSTKSLSILVQGNPKLIVDSVTTIPSDIEPGGFVKLNFKIKNIGSGTARQLQASLNSTSSFLVPVLSGGMVYIGNIGPGETGEALMELSIGSLAEYKTYTSVLTLNYNDESNTPTSDTFNIGIPVTGSIRLDIINVEANFNRQLLDIEVANKGTTDAKSVEAVFIVNNETVGIDYISQLKSTKKTTFSFPLVLEGRGDLVINYVGPGLEENQVTKVIDMNFSPPTGNGTASMVFYGFILLIIIVVVYWKFIRKNKHHTHHSHPAHNTHGKKE